MRRLAFILTIAFAVLFGGRAQARPVSFVGSKMPMLRAQPMMVEASLDFTPIRRLSIGATYDWMRRANSEELACAGVDLNFLLWRMNGEDLQANAFFLSTWGALVPPSGSIAPAGILSIEADAESRRLYGLVQARVLRSTTGIEDRQLIARAGVAPFVGEFTEINPWIIVQYQYMPSFNRVHTITPMVRLMYLNILVEVGASLRGEPLVNFTAEI